MTAGSGCPFSESSSKMHLENRALGKIPLLRIAKRPPGRPFPLRLALPQLLLSFTLAKAFLPQQQSGSVTAPLHSTRNLVSTLALDSRLARIPKQSAPSEPRQIRFASRYRRIFIPQTEADSTQPLGSVFVDPRF
jgi:hypothetical protein